VEKLRLNEYSIPMTALERQILDHLIALDTAVRSLSTASPKPNLLPRFQQIEELADQLPRSTAPDLLHYLQKKSYEKARQWLQGRYAEIQKGGCQR
jgi:DNA-binding transcriptional MocR family regulator